MRVLLVHPSCLMYAEIYLRLEPLGLELVAAAARQAGHAVLPTKLPLDRFYQELVKTQQVINKKHLGFAALRDTFFIVVKLLAQGQTNFLRMLWKFNQVYNPGRQFADHKRAVRYEMLLPQSAPQGRLDRKSLYVHRPESAQAVG